jgi:hypothetical protein
MSPLFEFVRVGTARTDERSHGPCSTERDDVFGDGFEVTVEERVRDDRCDHESERDETFGRRREHGDCVDSHEAPETDLTDIDDPRRHQRHPDHETGPERQPASEREGQGRTEQQEH